MMQIGRVKICGANEPCPVGRMKTRANGGYQTVASKVLKHSVDVHGGEAKCVAKCSLRYGEIGHMIFNATY
ncbi:hypothetical protein X745_31700 [Mesorhizobium sp. LNJC374B00]|nr:hypothetical protein X745_31700 [Mesorhizobium sp. LNJC374B00]